MDAAGSRNRLCDCVGCKKIQATNRAKGKGPKPREATAEVPNVTWCERHIQVGESWQMKDSAVVAALLVLNETLKTLTEELHGLREDLANQPGGVQFEEAKKSFEEHQAQQKP